MEEEELEIHEGMHEMHNITVFRHPKLILAADEDGVMIVDLHPDYLDVTAASSSHLPKIDIQIITNQHGDLERAACIYLHSKIKSNQKKSMKSDATALLMYFRYLATSEYEDKFGVHPLKWDVHPFATDLKPVHHFKNWLFEQVELGTPAISTARAYLLAVIRFYKFCMYRKLHVIDERNTPFEILWTKVNINSKPDQDMYSHTRAGQDGHWVMTTDVLKGFHKNTKQTKRQKLRPLIARHQDLFLENLHLLSERDQLMHECSLKIGLRATECATLKADLITNPMDNEPVEISIGPETRVETKYSTQRTVKVPAELMRRLYVYKESDKRQKYVKRGEKDSVFKGDLFLTTKGKAMSGETLSKYFIRYASKLQLIDITFAHKHHNLRSTFATNYLWKEHTKGRTLALAGQDLMLQMGHQNFSTTLEYVGFIETELTKKEHSNVLSGIVERAMSV